MKIFAFVCECIVITAIKQSQIQGGGGENSYYII